MEWRIIMIVVVIVLAVVSLAYISTSGVYFPRVQDQGTTLDRLDGDVQQLKSSVDELRGQLMASDETVQPEVTHALKPSRIVTVDLTGMATDVFHGIRMSTPDMEYIPPTRFSVVGESLPGADCHNEETLMGYVRNDGLSDHRSVWSIARVSYLEAQNTYTGYGSHRFAGVWGIPHPIMTGTVVLYVRGGYKYKFDTDASIKLMKDDIEVGVFKFPAHAYEVFPDGQEEETCPSNKTVLFDYKKTGNSVMVPRNMLMGSDSEAKYDVSEPVEVTYDTTNKTYEMDGVVLATGSLTTMMGDKASHTFYEIPLLKDNYHVSTNVGMAPIDRALGLANDAIATATQAESKVMTHQHEVKTCSQQVETDESGNIPEDEKVRIGAIMGLTEEESKARGDETLAGDYQTYCSDTKGITGHALPVMSA